MNHDVAKWECIRRLRYGALIKLFRHRWGNVLPNDDAGRGDLWLLVTNVSLAAAEPEKKMHHVIEMWAPWMSDREREEYVRHVWGLDLYERTETAEAIGRQLGLTNAEREKLKLWPFKPIDKTDAELAEQAKVRERERRARKRREKGIRTKAAYLAERASKPKPWIAQGISRSTYYRRRRLSVYVEQRGVRLGEVETIVSKHRPQQVSPNPVSTAVRPPGGEVVQGRCLPSETSPVENPSSSPDLRTHHVSPHLIAAMKNWGANARNKRTETDE
jgi:hypothetical protein